MKLVQIINIALAFYGRVKSKHHRKLFITYLVHGCTKEQWAALGEDTGVVRKD